MTNPHSNNKLDALPRSLQGPVVHCGGKVEPTIKDKLIKLFEKLSKKS